HNENLTLSRLYRNFLREAVARNRSPAGRVRGSIRAEEGRSCAYRSRLSTRTACSGHRGDPQGVRAGLAETARGAARYLHQRRKGQEPEPQLLLPEGGMATMRTEYGWPADYPRMLVVGREGRFLNNSTRRGNRRRSTT